MHKSEGQIFFVIWIEYVYKGAIYMGDNAVQSEYWVNTSSAPWNQTVKQPHKNEQKFAGKKHVASDKSTAKQLSKQ